MKNKNPLVAIITINYNHSDDTIKCLESVLKSDYENYIVYVVDNGSDQSDFQKLKTFGNQNNFNTVRLDVNKGYVGGVNFGLSNALKINPDYFLIMNNDTLIDKDAIRELVITAKKYENNAIVSGKVYNMDEPDTLQYIGQYCVNHNKLDYRPYINNEREKDTGHYDHEKEMDMLDDIFWLLPQKIFQEVKYYSKYFFLYGEQNDYVLRAVNKGFKLIYTPKAKLWHLEHLTTGGGIRNTNKVIYWQTYSSFILAFLHLNKYYFTKFYLKLTIKFFIKHLLNVIKIYGSPYSKAHFLASVYFTFWLFNRKENNGFNPFN